MSRFSGRLRLGSKSSSTSTRSSSKPIDSRSRRRFHFWKAAFIAPATFTALPPCEETTVGHRRRVPRIRAAPPPAEMRTVFSSASPTPEASPWRRRRCEPSAPQSRRTGGQRWRRIVAAAAPARVPPRREPPCRRAPARTAGSGQQSAPRPLPFSCASCFVPRRRSMPTIVKLEDRTLLMGKRRGL